MLSEENLQKAISQRFAEIYDELKNEGKFSKQGEFCEAVGLNEGNFQKYYKGERKINTEILVNMKEKYGVSLDWLLTGEPTSQKEESDGREPQPTQAMQVFTTGKEKHHELQHIPLYDITAAAGLSQLYNSTNNILDFIQIPNLPRCDGAINVKGDSMYPLLKHGDIVVFQRLVDIPDELMFGEMYVVDMSTPHLERIYVKYVQKSEKGERSQKETHPPDR